MKTTLAGAIASALLLGSAAVSAAPVSLKVCNGDACWNGDYTIQDATLVEWDSVENLDNAIGYSTAEWAAAQGLPFTVTDWSLDMDSDPFVTNNFTITNTSGVVQTYTMIATIGVAPAIPNGAMRGSIGFTLTDNNGDDATLTSDNSGAGVSIYRAQIDGNTARTLWDAPFSFTTLASIGTDTTSTKFGFPVREAAPESADTNIGIAISFTLTPGDSVAFTSNFDVTPVPVPAAVWLFGTGLIGLATVARRRS